MVPKPSRAPTFTRFSTSTGRGSTRLRKSANELNGRLWTIADCVRWVSSRTWSSPMNNTGFSLQHLHAELSLGMVDLGWAQL